MINEENSPQRLAEVVNGPSAQLHSDTPAGEGLLSTHLSEVKAPVPRWGAQPRVGKEEGAPLLPLRTTSYIAGLISHCSKGGFPPLAPFPRG